MGIKKRENTEGDNVKMTTEYKRYRKESGMAKFEKDCRLTYERHRLKKAYKIPGTQEAGRYAMFIRHLP